MTEKKLPSKLKCVKCGDKKGVRKDVLEKRIAKFGTLSSVINQYHCIKCRKVAGVRADGKLKPTVTPRDPDKIGGVNWDTAAFRALIAPRTCAARLMTDQELKDSTTPGKGGQCLRIDIFHANGRACDGCPYFERDGVRFCQQPDAMLKVEAKKVNKKKSYMKAYQKKKKKK